MTLTIIKGYLVTYQRQGNDKNGNPIYIVNIFDRWGNVYVNRNRDTGRRLDKYGNIRIQSYNIPDTLERLVNAINDTEKE